jgi:hypothetical protein
MALSSIDTITPYPLPSPPSTPTSEEDLSRSQAWQEDFQVEPDKLQSKKGKERQLQEEYAYASDEALEHTYAGVYPPMSDDEAETRRVEEVRMPFPQISRYRHFCVMPLLESQVLGSS